MSEALRNKIERHASALENASAAMERDGIGLGDRTGHVSVLKRMASDLRAQAARGITPSGFEMMYSSAAPRLSAQALATVNAAGLGFLLAGTDTIAMDDLNVSFAETGTPPADRIAIKQILASAGKLTA